MSIPVTVNGVKYRSIKQACEMLNKPLGGVMSRLRNDCSIDQAFNLPNMLGTPSRDHLDHIYPTFKDMCQAWGKSISTIRYRLDKGLDIKTALTLSTSKANGTLSKDHLGNEFCSIKEMCKFWRIKDSTFFSRVDQGMSIEEALTIPVNKNHSTPSKDHLGNNFNSIKEMCKFWRISPNTFSVRLNKGMSIKEALTTPVNKKISKGKNKSVASNHD